MTDTILAGSVAVVTGGSRGIGFATAARLCESGASVAFCGRAEDVGRDAERRLRDLGHDAAFFPCDVADESSVESFLGAARQRFGDVDILVNNAGVNAIFDAATMTIAQWDEFFAVDLRSAWLTVKHLIDGMKERRRGSIINVSSLHGFATTPNFFPYAAAKSGLVGLTRSMALDFGEWDIRVNCVAPGFVRTRLVQESIDRFDDRAAAEQAMVRGVALGRIAEPSEIAEVIHFFASPASSYVTGASLLVDGGLTARRAG
ncbi:SDR family NAD(P)-dependent oxidoreductase [Microbacterium sp. 179-I 3D3 NHS]|uniref:SDR family NAD(P)-dependent oxidoreductase n=1 Tax=unclassified Microbacterium TaxID=2609290 RepID=UPI00399F4931